MRETKLFRLKNHDSEITRDLEIGKVYELFSSWFRTNKGKRNSWVLSIDDTSKIFDEEDIDKYFETEHTNIIGYGQTY